MVSVAAVLTWLNPPLLSCPPAKTMVLVPGATAVVMSDRGVNGAAAVARFQVNPLLGLQMTSFAYCQPGAAAEQSKPNIQWPSWTRAVCSGMARRGSCTAIASVVRTCFAGEHHSDFVGQIGSAWSDTGHGIVACEACPAVVERQQRACPPTAASQWRQPTAQRDQHSAQHSASSLCGVLRC
jgi:hypothetical protein